jgi:hypothetical protein
MKKARVPIFRATAAVSLAKIEKDANNPRAKVNLLAEVAEALSDLPGAPALLNPRREALLDLIVHRFILAATDQLDGAEALQAKLLFHQQTDQSTMISMVHGLNETANLPIILNNSFNEYEGGLS